MMSGSGRDIKQFAGHRRHYAIAERRALAPLASGEVVYLYRNGLLLGAVTMVGALNWTYSDSGLVSGAYTYSARVVDLAGISPPPVILS